MLHQSAFLLALRNASPGTECASPTSVPHFLVDRPFAVVWLYFSWLPRWRDSFRALGGSLFGVPSTDRGSRLRDMSNFCCLPGRAGGTPLLVSGSCRIAGDSILSDAEGWLRPRLRHGLAVTYRQSEGTNFYAPCAAGRRHHARLHQHCPRTRGTGW